MGADCFINDPYFDRDNFNNVNNYNFSSLDYLLQISDVVITSVVLNQTTKGIVNYDFINKMKDGVVFINTSRGDVVDENALLSGLKSGKINTH